jgi:hypothetical protein
MSMFLIYEQDEPVVVVSIDAIEAGIAGTGVHDAAVPARAGSAGYWGSAGPAAAAPLAATPGWWKRSKQAIFEVFLQSFVVTAIGRPPCSVSCLTETAAQSSISGTGDKPLAKVFPLFE